MGTVDKRFQHKHASMIRDVRPLTARIAESLQKPSYSAAFFVISAGSIFMFDWALAFADVILIINCLFFWWLTTRSKGLYFKLPKGAPFMDPHNGRDGKPGKPDGILYLGNSSKDDSEVWFTNSDARTHILYLGTTGAGKTEGLKSMVTNTMAWSSGFVYVDGKADTDLWSSLSSLVRRFGRDDDLLVLNYMTGNSDAIAPSNTMNPFSSGSASYLVNMLTELMPDAEGDNAMWKERAVSLVSAMMPALTYKRDHQDVPMSVRTIRDYLSLNNVIKLARDEFVPAEIRSGLTGYLDTLPGFTHEAYDDEGNVKPPDGGGPPPDTTTANQQHGYLAMQFTRALQSLGDDYGYIFDTQAADVDMMDVVLNRRILVVLIPALEKSGDEIANLGKIVAATMKGMMGSTLGSTVEGSSATVIENKPTHSATPFMTVFDEVGYYTASGMAVMAAQARSLGFCLVFSGQDLPALKKRVREEANSITANCNIKIFGKLEDPTETKEFFEKTVGQVYVTEVSGFQTSGGSYSDTQQAGVQLRARASYDGLKKFKEGQAVVSFGENVEDCNMFYSNPGFAKAMRVTRFMSLPPPDDNLLKHANKITQMRDLMVNKTWTAMKAEANVEVLPEIDALRKGFFVIDDVPYGADRIMAGIAALAHVHGIDNPLDEGTPTTQTDTSSATDTQTPTAPAPPLPAETPAASPLESTVPAAPATPPPAEETSQPPPTKPPAATEQPPAYTDGNPMAFFGSDDKKPEEPSATEAPTAPQWDKIIEEGLEKGPSTEPEAGAIQQIEGPPPSTPADAKSEQGNALPQEIEDIIRAAGRETRKSIFGDESDNNENS